MSVDNDIVPAEGHPAKYHFAGAPKAGIAGQEGTNAHAAPNVAGVPASAGMTGALRRFGLTAAAVAGGLLALDLIGLAATVYFGPELLEAAESAGVAHLLQR